MAVHDDNKSVSVNPQTDSQENSPVFYFINHTHIQFRVKGKGARELPAPRLEMMQEVQKVYRTNYIIYYQQLEHCLFWVIMTLKPNTITHSILNITKNAKGKNYIKKPLALIKTGFYCCLH